INLGDKRLNERLIKITGQFISSTQSPINQACGDWAETKAAYRFFQNDNVDYKDIVGHHAQITKSRFENEDVILAIQDTTYFNYTDHPKTKGLGVLSRFTGKYKKDIITSGLYMHSTMAINTDGLPLGLLDQKITARTVLPKEKIEIKKRSHNMALSIEEKESIRWLDSMRASASLFGDQNKKVVTLADREADIYDLYLLAEEIKTHYLIRASHNRKINKSAVHSEISGEMLWDFMGKQKIEGEIQVKVPAKGDHPKRIATCNVKIGKIKVLPPRGFKGSKAINTELTLYSIQVEEFNPPKGANKIDWILHTNIPVHSYEDAIEKVKWYCLRWRIEIYFKVIKSGFNVESCRLETADRLIRYLAIISIVAWRVYWLTLVSRTETGGLPSEFLTEDEWKILFVKFNPACKIPKRPPSLRKVTMWIAQLGGFLARRGDGSPGITHIWRGLKKLADMMVGIQIYGHIYG
ncbi:MAG: IS4 family transposase, partial [Methyloprofundus sp.]|nr:IS4 family transposase [Methyloprofundus sp.]